jgi:4-hydroxy-4-methyl-2-oxoglutarate aldolase
MQDLLTPGQLDALRHLSTCTVANAIETFEVRLRNTGFTDASVRCVFPTLPPMVGYAATARIRCSLPPMQGHAYVDRTDWWGYLLTIPAPRVIVLEDGDRSPGLGSFVGEVHANILLALGCVGVVTNGAVRDLHAIEPTGFQMFSGNVAVSHAYAHIFEFGGPVQVAGLKISPGNILHGDRHGVLTIPAEIVGEVPSVARKLIEREQRIVGFCRSPEFSLDRLRELLKT